MAVLTRAGEGRASLRSAAFEASRAREWLVGPTRVVGLGCRDAAHIPGELEHLTPLSAKEGAAECSAQSRLATHTLSSYASKCARPFHSATPCVGAGPSNTKGPSPPRKKGCAQLHRRNISPLYAKGGRHGAALVTDLATEHLHALQNGLVTHGCKGGCPETEEAWRLADEVLAATKSTGGRPHTELPK